MSSRNKFRVQLFLAAVVTCAVFGLVYAISLWPIIGLMIIGSATFGLIFFVALTAIRRVMQ